MYLLCSIMCGFFRRSKNKDFYPSGKSKGNKRVLEVPLHWRQYTIGNICSFYGYHHHKVILYFDKTVNE